MQGNIYLLIPILLPILAGIAVLAMPDDRKLRNLTVTCALGATALSAAGVLLFGDTSLVIWWLTDRIAISLRPDTVGRMFLVLIAFVWTGVGIYSFSYMEHEKHQKRFYLFYLTALGVLMGLSMAGNIVTFYMFYEAMTLSTLPLVMHTMTKEAVAAGIKYLIYSVFGASAALLGIFFIGTYGTTFDFTAGGVLDMVKASGNENLLLAVFFLMLVGFGVKAGMFPLHSWLPTAHPVAPAPASAVLSGVITKAGVLGVIRTIFYLAGPNFLRGTWVQTAVMILTLITVLMGSALALKEKMFKRRLAYSSVSQVSYILFGLITMTTAGFAGAFLHILFHSLIKDTLFMSAGAVIHKTGKTNTEDLTGIGKQMPVTMWCFTIAALGLIGIPPTGGFISKWQLAQGALSMSGPLAWVGPMVLLISALLTAAYLLTITIRGFFPGKEYEDTLVKNEAANSMLIPMAVFAALVLLIGMFPGALITMINTVSATVM